MTLKVLYILPPTRTYAGIERVVDNICSALARDYKEKFSVDVLFVAPFRNYEVPERPFGKISRNAVKRLDVIRTVRQTVAAKDYDLVVIPQVEATTICWLSCIGISRRFILYLHGNPNLEVRSIRSRIWFLLMKFVVLRHLAGVFGVSPRQLEYFRAKYPSKVPHFWVPNPVQKFSDTTKHKGGGDDNVVTFVNIGRFSFQKGQDILLSAFSKLSKLCNRARLKVVGFGPSEQKLRETIQTLSLSDVVQFEHYPDNPQIPLSASDVLVSTSRWEGWSLAICEGLRFGLPVVSTECDFGPSDILTDRRLGTLVPPGDEKALLEAMLYYCNNLELEQGYAEFRKEYVDRFSVERVVRVHAEALLEIATATGRGKNFEACRA